MFDTGSTQELGATRQSSYSRRESRPVSGDVFVPKAERISDSRAKLESRLPRSEAQPHTRFFDITEPPPIYKIKHPMTAERYVDEALRVPTDFIEISQMLAKILVPAAALGSVAGILAYLAPLIPGALELLGTGVLVAGGKALGVVGATLAYPPVGLAVGAAFLLWAAFQIRNENMTYQKAEAVRARRSR
ncbi:hypothetical protein K2P56_01375 [Patescibacteria group bacterium]|nr:hypothetical protein [Patescibacteria group bacterium]